MRPYPSRTGAGQVCSLSASIFSPGPPKPKVFIFFKTAPAINAAIGTWYYIIYNNTTLLSIILPVLLLSLYSPGPPKPKVFIFFKTAPAINTAIGTWYYIVYNNTALLSIILPVLYSAVLLCRLCEYNRPR